MIVPKSALPRKAALLTPSRKKGVNSSGSPNYSDADFEKLFEIEEEMETIGSNDWSAVAAGFNEYMEE